jgi:hypothetical protein
MRKLVWIGMFVGCLWAAPSAEACDPRGGNDNNNTVEVIIELPTFAAKLQSQTFLADATKLDSKADTEESASATSVASARALRRKAASIRVQAAQVSEPSQSALFAKADRLDAQAATSDAASATFLARARIIRTRAKALRTLSARVLKTGAISTQVLARIELPAPPAGHPDKTALRMLDAAPKAASPQPKPKPPMVTTAVVARL